MKRTISLILVLALLVCTVPAALAASHPFTDVPDNAWYAKFVEYVHENELMSGTSETTFSPHSYMTRGMVVTVLYRIAGTPATSGTHPFSDVKAGAWFEKPIAWAYENKVVSGTSATTFAPNMNITREQIVAIFFSYAKSQGYDTSARADISGYADKGAVHSYAVDAFRWAVATGVISGTDATHLSPAGNATRAQCAAILKSFVAWVESTTEAPEPSEPTEPAPTEPAPTEPAPTEPAPTEPEPTESQPTEPEVPAEYNAALDEAEDYLSIMPFSYLGLIKQLEYEGYSHEAAVYAADNCGADWFEQAVLTAKDYLDSSAFSYEGLIGQLEYEKFTSEQAKYGADNCGADWFEQAVLMAKEYIDSSAFSYEGLIDQLEYEEFTPEQAKYGADNCGADWNAEALECALDYLEYSDFTYDELYDQLIYEGFTENQAVYALTNCGVDWGGSGGSGPVIPDSSAGGNTYIINTNTGKFHEPGCSSAANISPANRYEYVGSRDALVANGWSPCGRCDP